MDIFRKVAGAFVELDPVAEAATPAPTKAAQAAASVQPRTFTGPSVDQVMLDALQKKISGRQTPYTALLENAENLKEVIPDEIMRLKAAFKTITKDGNRTIASIIQAIDLHVSDIEGERARFRATTEQQIKAKSGALRDQASQLKTQCAANEVQIAQFAAEQARLQEQMNVAQSKMLELNHQADMAEADILATSTAFDNAVEFTKTDLITKKTSLSAVLS